MSKVLSFVFKFPLGDCTNNGVTSKVDSIYLHHGPDADLADLEDLPDDELILVERTLGGRDAWYAVPVGAYKNNRGTMAGGNFIYSSDSRFPSDAPISVHDRIEE